MQHNKSQWSSLLPSTEWFLRPQGHESAVSLQIWLFKLVSVALIQTRTHNGGSSWSWGYLAWPLLSERSILTYCTTFLRSRWNTFLSQSLLHLKPHTVCGFKPFHAPLTTRYPSERPASRSQVFGCIFHGIFLFMPLIYDGPLAARWRLTLT